MPRTASHQNSVNHFRSKETRGLEFTVTNKIQDQAMIAQDTTSSSRFQFKVYAPINANANHELLIKEDMERFKT